MIAMINQSRIRP